ncbi:uncharacterized protein LOC6542251 isoform X1 [Drosophila erecta]|uniref:Uncharacterized protein, isoform B n=2 Tax=Drosophila erecta TaxID=7220 RepID=A0A0Q5WA34_DROER|nr:uncharacterized protein LOC6542251 isoform X1 [Drosophila erecta]KQS70358.1 uncharacterized protein Dere_GG24046, isoform B [Drosophila erecta]
MTNKKMFNRTTSVSPGQLHYYHTDFYYSMPDLHKTRKMHGVKRVLVFCLMIVILPAILIIMPLHLRKTVFADVIYPMAESDIIEIRAGISSIFCSKHTLRMSSNFNAFQLRNKPEIATNRKHIRLKKSMTLPDDTLEYWGFFLLKGAKVRVKFCSRYDGSRILIIHGHRELNLCGLTDHNKNKLGANYAKGHEQVQVFFEDNVEITEEKGNQDVLMEHENHGGEDLTEDVSQPQLNMPVKQNNSIQPKLIRKKLKKGTIHHGEHDPYAITDLQGSHHTEHILNHHQSSNSPAHQRDQSSNITNKEASRNHIPYEDFADQNSSKTHHSGESPPHRERLKRHNRGSHRNQKRQDLYDTLYKRSKRENVYDRKTIHGGNAINFTETDESNSVSSFETGLFQCFNGMILLQEFFRPKNECSNPHIMDTSPNKSSMVVHNVIEDGYYYYIFYSDNDHVQNEIHAIFDIYKPTYQYSNMSESQSCLNTTNCTFNISFLSDEIVVVEVPTRDGIEHEEDDITNLVSTCHPRSEIYAIFPITVLVLILCCSFL